MTFTEKETPSRSHEGDLSIDYADLTLRMTRGDEEAFLRFHTVYYSRILRYTYVVTNGNESDALDVAQETFLKVVKHIRPFDSQEKLWWWLTRLARSAASDQRRRRSRWLGFLKGWFLHWRENLDPVEEQEAFDPVGTVEFAISQLKPSVAELVRQKYLEGRSIRELAESLEITEKAVESRLTRARASLRKILGSDAPLQSGRATSVFETVPLEEKQGE